MYFTSWDANAFLCLLSVFPEEVVRRMIKMVKKTHEDYVREETLAYWLELPDPGGTIVRVGKANRAWWKKRKNLKEFSELWRWRCPESRRERVIQWTLSKEEISFSHYWMNNTFENAGKGTSKAGYWNSGGAWCYSIKDWELDTSEWEGHEEDEYFDMKERERREYVSDWYGNIHEGRYFLFFKENDMVSSDYVVTTGRWQIVQDLLTIDGSGLGEKPGNHIEHIDDLFSFI
jgi:hypothetical protein